MRKIATVTLCIVAWSCRRSGTDSTMKQRERTAPDSSSAVASAVSVHTGTEPRVVQRDTVSLSSPPWTAGRVVEQLRAVGLNPRTESARVVYPGIPVPGVSVRIHGG